jgi:hypothetical protein
MMTRKRDTMVTRPGDGDVVVRRGNAAGFVLDAGSAPDPILIRTRDEAVTRAMTLARHQRVRAWFANSEGGFVLLGTFREDVEPAQRRGRQRGHL